MRSLSITVLLIVGTIVAASSLQAGVVVNYGTSPWAFDTADGNGTSCSNVGSVCQPGSVTQMVYGPGTPPLGTGSANLETAPGGGDGAAVISDTALDGMLVSSLTALSYSTYDTVNNGQQFPYLALSVTYDGGADSDIWFFEPPYQTNSTGNPGCAAANEQATEMNHWQTWDALNGCWWDDDGVANPAAGPGGVASLSTLLAAEPDATIEPLGSLSFGFNNNEGGLALQVGYASSGDNFNGYVDNVTIGVSGVNTTYDFEATPEPQTVTLLGFGLLAIGFAGLKKKHQHRSS